MEYDFQKELKGAKHELYEKAECEHPGWPLGIPRIPLPNEIRKLLEDRALEVLGLHSEDELEGDPVETENYIDYLRTEIYKHQESIVKQKSGIQSIKAKGTNQKWSEWRRQLFNQRFDIAAFVIVNREPGKRQPDWQRMTEEWNKQHPTDTVNPAQMARRYHRGINDQAISVQIEALNSPAAMRYLVRSQGTKSKQDSKAHIKIIESPIVKIIEIHRREPQNERTHKTKGKK